MRAEAASGAGAQPFLWILPALALVLLFTLYPVAHTLWTSLHRVMILLPGEAHSTLGFAKFYALTAQAAADDARREAAWKFIEYMGGGDYEIARRWAVEKGLGFAQLPLFDDPDVQAAWSTWIDVDKFKQQATLARNGTWTEWTGIWSAYFRPLLAQAMVGEASVEEVMQAGADKWIEYRILLRGN
jgi:ABC-type glycerol-3-phosphate transport system substrate-binding protein